MVAALAHLDSKGSVVKVKSQYANTFDIISSSQIPDLSELCYSILYFYHF